MPRFRAQLDVLDAPRRPESHGPALLHGRREDHVGAVRASVDREVHVEHTSGGIEIVHHAVRHHRRRAVELETGAARDPRSRQAALQAQPEAAFDLVEERIADHDHRLGIPERLDVDGPAVVEGRQRVRRFHDRDREASHRIRDGELVVVFLEEDERSEERHPIRRDHLAAHIDRAASAALAGLSPGGARAAPASAATAGSTRAARPAAPPVPEEPSRPPESPSSHDAQSSSTAIRNREIVEINGRKNPTAFLPPRRRYHGRGVRRKGLAAQRERARTA